MDTTDDAISRIFKAYDIRGKVGSELTADVAGRIGQAFSAWLPPSDTKHVTTHCNDMLSV